MTAEPAGAAQFGAVAAMAIDVGLQLVAVKKRCVEHNLHRTSGTLAIVERQIHFAFRYQPVVEIQFARLDDVAHICALTRIEKVVLVVFAPIFGIDGFPVVQILVGGHKWCVFSLFCSYQVASLGHPMCKGAKCVGKIRAHVA